jgi:hypothetical protein
MVSIGAIPQPDAKIGSSQSYPLIQIKPFGLLDSGLAGRPMSLSAANGPSLLATQQGNQEQCHGDNCYQDEESNFN